MTAATIPPAAGLFLLGALSALLLYVAFTKRLDARHELAAAHTRFRLAFESAPNGIIIVDAATASFVDVNQRFADMVGAVREDLIGMPLQSIVHPDDWEVSAKWLGQVAREEVANYRLSERYVHTDGREIWVESDVNTLRGDDGRVLAFGNVEDVTERLVAASRLQWAATHDDLTGLFNRAHFLERLRSRLEHAEVGSVAMLFIDLDNFKVINDSLGHAVGDALLVSMAHRLQAMVREDDVLSRFGGDEFLVMLDAIAPNADSPLQVAERLRREIARSIVLDDAEFVITSSIGIAICDRRGTTALDLMRDADAAMYRAKARGRNCVEVFAPGAHETSVLALRTTSELRRGLERGEIVPYYQPIVELSTGKLTGFEVLARWRHPKRGVLTPDQFLPLAEEIGLIGQLGGGILHVALEQLALWRATDINFADITMAVNVSARQLVDPHFTALVETALSDSGVPAELLWLEITESALMSDVKAASIALRDLRNLGLHLSVDDFGTGYASLTYLRRFPVEAIKVDRSFVDGLGVDAEDSRIVEAVINLGKSLDLLVVAEGVETPLHLARLREAGCDHGQGFLIGRPKPPNLIDATLTSV